jgi:hypothetical protein
MLTKLVIAIISHMGSALLTGLIAIVLGFSNRKRFVQALPYLSCIGSFLDPCPSLVLGRSPTCKATFHLLLSGSSSMRLQSLFWE